ncbi:hypothetical protein FOWG_17435 [Fusarium oxysporum f. sp. lycopersici MN25]|nr:hypothetical protein FOWG_17435 [Fusarium oxysporum f. sp. lycopersici MN25]
MAAAATGRDNAATEKKSAAPKSAFLTAMPRLLACNRITPKQIRTKGFTHLYGAFITIDLDTVAVKPWHEDDMKLYKEFTGLKKKGLETWIAIGGWTFNDSRPTRTTFSNLSASLAHRARFIKSLTSLLDEYGFQA